MSRNVIIHLRRLPILYSRYNLRRAEEEEGNKVDGALGNRSRFEKYSSLKVL
jgi:hypothetical protein